MVNKEFIEGAEKFREMMLEATNPIVWPTIEGVFAVFAKKHGFEPLNNVIEIVSGRRNDTQGDRDEGGGT